jgi:hypothetical protein
MSAPRDSLIASIFESFVKENGDGIQPGMQSLRIYTEMGLESQNFCLNGTWDRDCRFSLRQEADFMKTGLPPLTSGR